MPFPSLEDLPNPGIEPTSPALAARFVTNRATWETSLVAQRLKRLPAMRKTRVQSLGWEDPLEKEMSTHSSILAWEIPRTEEAGGPQSMELQKSQMCLSD